jgi:hypothetical protein
VDEAGAASGGSAAGPGGWRCCRGGMSWDGATPAGRVTWARGGEAARHTGPWVPAARGTTGGGVARQRGHAMRSRCGGAVALPTTPVSMGSVPAPGLLSRAAQSLSCQFWRRRAGAGRADRRRGRHVPPQTQRHRASWRIDRGRRPDHTVTHTISSPLGGSEHRIFLVAPARLASGYTSWRIKADAVVTCAARA